MERHATDRQTWSNCLRDRRRDEWRLSVRETKTKRSQVFFVCMLNDLLGVLHAPAWEKNILWGRPCLSVSFFWNPLLRNNGIQGFPLLLNNMTSGHILQERPKVIVGKHLCDNGLRSH
jgi:hypothetical protein